MKNAMRMTLAGILLAGALTGCVQWISKPVDSQVGVKSAAKPVVISDMKKVAVFPFADYSQAQPYAVAPDIQINQRVLEDVTDYFVGQGIEVAVQEDVNGLLISEGVVLVMKKDAKPASVDWELNKNYHTPLMQENMSHMLSDSKTWNIDDGKIGLTGNGATAGISAKMLAKLGSELGVDKVLRGRIIDYSVVKAKSMNPANGIVAVALGGLIEGSGAFAYQDCYEKGLPPSTPRDRGVYDDRPFEFTAGVAIPPEERIGVVQIRLYLQDVATGKVLWSNRAQLRLPGGGKSAGVNNAPQSVLDGAVKEAVKALMEDLFKPPLVLPSAA